MIGIKIAMRQSVRLANVFLSGTSFMRQFSLKAPSLAAIAIIALGAGAFSPAYAFDDKVSTFEPLLGVVGLGKDNEEKPDIDYRERPRLVVPKAMELPPPQERSNSRAANWPKDQDIARRKEAAAAQHAPRGLEINKNPTLDNHEMMKGRSASNDKASEEPCDTRVNGVYDCGSLTPVEKLKRVFSTEASESEEMIKPGLEPKREYLTEPPNGFRKATRAVKATTERPVERENGADAGQYYRDQAKRNYNPDR